MPVVPEEKNLGKRSELKQQSVWFLKGIIYMSNLA